MSENIKYRWPFIVSLGISLFIFSSCSQLIFDPNFNTGKKLSSQGQDADAIEYFELALRDNPNNQGVWFMLGYSYYNLGRYKEAIRAYDRSQLLTPECVYSACESSDYPSILFNIGLSYQQLGNYQNARIYYEEAIRIYPDFSRARTTLATLSNLSSFNEPQIATAPKIITPALPSTPKLQQKPKPVPSVYSGTGFLFSDKDYIITNWHVVRGTKNIRVKFLNGESIRATLVLKDPQNDIAFLKLERPPQLPASNLKIGDSSKISMGDKVFTIGYPAHWIMGKNPKYTEGVVNATSGLQDDPTVFQISVQIQPGNSGGPLFNESGEVIGITQASLDPKVAIGTFGTLPQNVNYAIKSNYISTLLPMLPETMLASRGIVVIPAEPEHTLSNFIKKVKKNIVLIEARE